MNNMTIREKLNLIQTTLKAPKGQYNSFAKYKYRNCEDILEALKPLLKETKTVIKLSDEIVNIGTRFYVKATAELLDCESKEWESVTAYAREAEQKKGQDESQITGATSSYARKYALNGLLAVDDTKDADSEEQKPVAPVVKKPYVPYQRPNSGGTGVMANQKDFEAGLI